MKYRTNAERRERKAKKAIELREKSGRGRRLSLRDSFLGYHEIVRLVKTKIPYRKIRNAHKRLGIEAQYLMPRFIREM